MISKQSFLVPSYYKNFKCKGFDCRNSCCKGWDVSISMKEYYNLQSMNCSKKLRKHIDRALVIVKNPTKERYAVVTKTVDNDCVLHMPNGYCMLQFECGENILPAICHYYP